MRLGILGTMVWDRIHSRDGRSVPFEEWGGITYALAAADACRPTGWSIVPILKVGADLEAQAYAFLGTLQRGELTAVRFVDAPNNRVELHYQDNERRCERLTGGVPAWTWEELAPLLEEIDALYINFISGFELDLEQAVRLRLGYHGPMYADLHSLMLGIDASGLRSPRPLDHWREWLRCFDVIQVNEEELTSLAAAWGDPWRFAAEVVGEELKLLLITLGSRGAAYVASAAFQDDPFSWRPRGIVVPSVSPRAAAVSKKLDAVQLSDPGDPTGCGDVWGATCFCRLLAGDGLEAAIVAANRAAARNVQHRGATGLNQFLQGRIAS